MIDVFTNITKDAYRISDNPAELVNFVQNLLRTECNKSVRYMSEDIVIHIEKARTKLETELQNQFDPSYFVQAYDAEGGPVEFYSERINFMIKTKHTVQ